MLWSFGEQTQSSVFLVFGLGEWKTESCTYTPNICMQVHACMYALFVNDAVDS